MADSLPWKLQWMQFRFHVRKLVQRSVTRLRFLSSDDAKLGRLARAPGYQF
jgi:hypothetical protein